MFVDYFPAPRKRQCTACFPDRFSIVFPSARTLHFLSVFTQNYEQWRPWKHVARPLFSCSMETAVNSLHCLSECFSVVYVSLRAQLLTVNVKKTWCSSIIFLLHGNANEQFVFWNAMKTTCSSIVIIISCSWSCPMKTPVNSLLNIQGPVVQNCD